MARFLRKSLPNLLFQVARRQTNFSKPICCSFSQISQAKGQDLWVEYSRAKAYVEGQPLARNRDPKAVYANNELDLDEIEVYGFDYDYTLACYQDSLHWLIYNMGREALIRDHKYLEEIHTLDFNPKFAVRGLHCDTKLGLLMKIDAFHNIQMGTVYRGLQPVSDEEVRDHYHGTHVAIDKMSSFYGSGHQMHQLMDLFALSEISLFANVVEYFNRNDIRFHPEYVFQDVKSAVQGLHKSGALHGTIMKNLDQYIGQQTEVKELLERLAAMGKKLFLITNSGPYFVDAGMRYLLGPNWTSMFDVIITNASKPKFFYEPSRPFRSFNISEGTKSWKKVDEFNKGYFYQEGNFYRLSQMTGWYGAKVLYFGDHVYTDLADEIHILNSDGYKQDIRWLMALEYLISNSQGCEDSESLAIRKEWLREKHELRLRAKNVFNPQFGSLFRTYHNPTYFTRRLNRFADIYMSSLTNLVNYSPRHTFYPRRAALPHELEDVLPF